MKKELIVILSVLIALFFAEPCGYAAEKTITFKLSVDTVENHNRNMGLKIFRCLLEKNSKGRLKVDYYHSAQIYKDRDIPKAIRMGTVEMAVPGNWILESVAPSLGVTSLPMFYGMPERVTKAFLNSELLDLPIQTLEKKLDVVVFDKWYYHGYAHVCSKTRPIKTLEDWKGLKIRHAGGASNAYRFEALGANPIMIPWPDLPMAMVQGTADGFLTTYKSFQGAKLWETGTKYSTRDRESYVFYVPMMNGKFFRGLPKDLQKVILDTWNEHVEMERAISIAEQQKGEDAMKAHGVEIYYPSDDLLAEWRSLVMKSQDKVVKEIRINKDYVARVQKFMEEQLK